MYCLLDCNGPLGMQSGAIDQDYMDFTYSDSSTIIDTNRKCEAGRYGPRLYQEYSWCTKKLTARMKITFPYLFQVNAIYLQFEDTDYNPDEISIGYSTLIYDEIFQNVNLKKDSSAYVSI